jgi:hypothetical protein
VIAIFTQFATEKGSVQLFSDPATDDRAVEHEVYLFVKKYGMLKNSIVRIKDFIQSMNIGSAAKFNTDIVASLPFSESNLFNLAEQAISTSSLGILVDVLQ